MIKSFEGRMTQYVTADFPTCFLYTLHLNQVFDAELLNKWSGRLTIIS